MTGESHSYCPPAETCALRPQKIAPQHHPPFLAPLTGQLGVSLDVHHGIDDGPHGPSVQQRASGSGGAPGDLSHCRRCIPLQLLVGVVQAEEEARDAFRGGHLLQRLKG